MGLPLHVLSVHLHHSVARPQPRQLGARPGLDPSDPLAAPGPLAPQVEAEAPVRVGPPPGEEAEPGPVLHPGSEERGWSGPLVVLRNLFEILIHVL